MEAEAALFPESRPPLGVPEALCRAPRVTDHFLACGAPRTRLPRWEARRGRVEATLLASGGCESLAGLCLVLMFRDELDLSRRQQTTGSTARHWRGRREEPGRLRGSRPSAPDASHGPSLAPAAESRVKVGAQGHRSAQGGGGIPPLREYN